MEKTGRDRTTGMGRRRDSLMGLTGSQPTTLQDLIVIVIRFNGRERSLVDP